MGVKRAEGGGNAPVDQVVVDFGGGKVRVVEDDGDGNVLGWKLGKSPLRVVS